MGRMDLAPMLRRTVLWLNKKHAGAGSSVQLSVAFNLSQFSWHDGSLEKLIEKLLRHASVISHPARPLRIAVRQRAKLLDLEVFWDIHPSHWIQLSLSPGAPGFDRSVRKILEDQGYRCQEWIRVEGSRQRLGAFSLGAEDKPKLVLWAENHRFRQRCDLLIPVADSLAL